MKFSKAQSGITKRGVSTLLALGLISQVFILSAEGAMFPVLEEHDRYTKDLLTGMKWLDGRSYVDTVHSTALSLNDYVVETRLTGRMKEKLKEGGAKFFFKKNKRVRMEVTKSAMSTGSVIVRREDGVVEGRGGGMLKFMKMTLQPDSRMLALPSGHSAISTDFPDLFIEVKSRLKNGTKARLASDTVTGNLWKGPVKIVELTEGDFANVTDRIYMNPKTNVPLEWDVYKDGSLISITFFDNFKGNIGLDDSLFDI